MTLLSPEYTFTNMVNTVRCAISIIKSMRFDHHVTAKAGYDGNEDFYTDADTTAQKICAERLTADFRGYGMIGEEKGLNRPCTLDGVNAYFTIDPLDGTRAYKRKHSYGIGVMISLVVNGRVAAAFIGDALLDEVVGYAFDGPVVRIYEGKTVETLVPSQLWNEPLSKQFILLRDKPANLHPQLAAVADSDLFCSWEINRGSIGVSLSRLFTGQMVAHLSSPLRDTPWDNSPYIGIAEKLGIAWLRPGKTHLEVFTPKPPLTTSADPYSTVAVPRRYAAEVIEASFVS